MGEMGEFSLCEKQRLVAVQVTHLNKLDLEINMPSKREVAEYGGLMVEA